jgi:FkbM family methyltransferase
LELEFGGCITRLFKELEWDYVVDNKKAGQEINGHKIISLKDVDNLGECYIVVSILFKYQDVVEQLIKSGACKQRILALGKIVEEKQYFDLPEINFSNEEVFLDIGGFKGETSLQFSKVTGKKYKKIYVIEPNEILANKCRENLSELDNCEVIQKATWSSSQKLKLVEEGESSRITEEYDINTIVETITVDKLLAGEKATYIKMDIEGAELESLRGAKDTICKNKPKLAISVYHKRDDIWEIPMLLLEYNPEYVFYLRVYSFTGNDTVLYAL